MIWLCSFYFLDSCFLFFIFFSFFRVLLFFFRLLLFFLVLRVFVFLLRLFFRVLLFRFRLLLFSNRLLSLLFLFRLFLLRLFLFDLFLSFLLRFCLLFWGRVLFRLLLFFLFLFFLLLFFRVLLFLLVLLRVFRFLLRLFFRVLFSFSDCSLRWRDFFFFQDSGITYFCIFLEGKVFVYSLIFSENFYFSIRTSWMFLRIGVNLFLYLICSGWFFLNTDFYYSVILWNIFFYPFFWNPDYMKIWIEFLLVYRNDYFVR